MSNLYAPASLMDRFNFLNGPFIDSSFGFFITDEMGILKYLNKEAARILGFADINDALGYSLHDFEMNVNCGLSDVFQNILKGEKFKNVEHRCTNRSGHYAVLNISLSPFREDGAAISGVMGTIYDITESHQEKVKLEESNYVLSVVSQVSEALASAAELNDVLRIILTGVTANQGLGFNRAFLMLINEEKNVLEGNIDIGPGSPEEAHEIWSHLAGRHRTLLELIEDLKETEKNSEFPVSSGIEEWITPLDKPSFFTDVLESGSGIIVNGNDKLSPESAKIFEYIKAECLAVVPIISKGRKLGVICADNKITGKQITDTRVKLLQIFANNSAVAIEHSRLYDKVSERAEELEIINRQLAESQEQIIRAEKMSVIGELTSSIAHELRNPLMVIGGFTNLMISSGDAGENAEYLNIILSETQRSESVLHQVLDFSRASRTCSCEIEFNSIVKEAYDYFQTKT
ncbi:MAG: PAS domain-containing protein, partial [candidate division Zixibacteria bacterium]|nr:PAS domain-containing protein [candidate division Zixibacteria bacterium]